MVDLPDITSDMDDETVARELQKAMTLTFPCPSAICVVVRADVRFTLEEHATYRRTMELVQGHVRNATERLVVVFTMADRLPAQLRVGTGGGGGGSGSDYDNDAATTGVDVDGGDDTALWWYSP